MSAVATAKKVRRVTVNDLPEHPDLDVKLHCFWCVESYSATRGDYFMKPKGAVMNCGECGKPLALVRRVVRLEIIR